VDVFRYYVIGAANPGLDLNYNFKDMDVTEKNLRVYWNVHKYVLEFAKNHQVKVVDYIYFIF
jgi:valyl-tRNA synthetase